MIPKNATADTASDWWQVLHARRHAVERLEAAFASLSGASFNLAVPRVSAGICDTLRALEICDSEVVVPTYNCPVVINAVVASGNRPVLADIDPAHSGIDPGDLGLRLSERTACVLYTEFYGYAGPRGEIQEVLGDRDLLILEDLALSLNPVGRWRQRCAGLYSFDRVKQLMANGGGILATADAALYRRVAAFAAARYREQSQAELLVRLAQHFMVLALFRPPIYAVAGRLKHRVPWLRGIADERSDRDFEMPPLSDARMSDWQATLVLAQLARRGELQAHKDHIAARYDGGLSGLPGVERLPARGPAFSLSHYSIRVRDRDQRRFRERLLARGVEPGWTMDTTLDQLPHAQHFVDADRARGLPGYPRARQLASEVVNLPFHWGLTDGHVDAVIDAVRRTAEVE